MLLDEKVNRLGVTTRNQSQFQLTKNIFSAIYAKEGVRGFFRGVAPSLAQTVAVRASFWTVYNLMQAGFTIADTVQVLQDLEELNKLESEIFIDSRTVFFCDEKFVSIMNPKKSTIVTDLMPSSTPRMAFQVLAITNLLGDMPLLHTRSMCQVMSCSQLCFKNLLSPNKLACVANCL